MKTLGKITAIILLVVFGFFVGLLFVYVIQKIAIIFDLNFVEQFSFVQLYGIWLLYSMFKFKYVKEEYKEKSFNDSLNDSLTDSLVKLFYILGMWGIAHIIFNILS